VRYTVRLMQEGLEAETSTENREAADLFVISLEEASERESDSDHWPAKFDEMFRALMVHRFGLIHLDIHSVIDEL
jgi:hypothetical protein